MTFEVELRALLEKATPGDWEASPRYSERSGGEYCEKCDDHIEHAEQECPAHLIGPVGIDMGDYNAYSVADMRLAAFQRNRASEVAAVVEAARVYREHAETYCDCPMPPPFACLVRLDAALEALDTKEGTR